MKKIYCLLIGCWFGLAQVHAQDAMGQLFNQLYPISENPNIGWKSSLVAREKILFEANPTVRYSFYNNVYAHFRDEDKAHKSQASAYYVSVRPQLRMYTDSSVPVKMPSYRILLGAQHIFKIRDTDFFAISLESGHYSNGQDGCTFSTKYTDGSPQSDSVLRAITPQTNLSKCLNRRNGEFSTDLTELVVNYRKNKVGRDHMPYETWSFKAGVTYYHNNFLFVLPFGGYEDLLIKVYGHWRYMGCVEFSHVRENGQRYSISETVELIGGAQESINPFRSETTVSYFLRNNFGAYASFIDGHDNYNIRFVDSGWQVSFGFCWNLFPTFVLGKKATARSEERGGEEESE